MPTYVYETIDEAPKKIIEFYQSIKDQPLSLDPESGRPIRRVISGGMEIPRARTDPPRIRKIQHSDSCACCHPRPAK